MLCPLTFPVPMVLICQNWKKASNTQSKCGLYEVCIKLWHFVLGPTSAATSDTTTSTSAGASAGSAATSRHIHRTRWPGVLQLDQRPKTCVTEYTANVLQSFARQRRLVLSWYKHYKSSVISTVLFHNHHHHHQHNALLYIYVCT